MIKIIILIIGLLITKNSFCYNQESNEKLLKAVENSNLEDVKKWLENEANPNGTCEDGSTLLNKNINNKPINLAITKLLLDKGADIDSTSFLSLINKNRNFFNIALTAIFHDKELFSNIGLKSDFAKYVIENIKDKKPNRANVIRDIPLSPSRNQSSLIKDFETTSEQDFSDKIQLIFNNDAYEKLSNIVFKSVFRKNPNYSKGQPLSSSRKENETPDPVGYSLWLPKNVEKTEAIIINAYGGNTNNTKPRKFDSKSTLPLKIFNYLLSKNIGIMILNTIDLKDNTNIQHIMPKDMFIRVLNNVKSAYDTLSSRPEILYENLKLLTKNIPLYFY